MSSSNSTVVCLYCTNSTHVSRRYFPKHLKGYHKEQYNAKLTSHGAVKVTEGQDFKTLSQDDLKQLQIKLNLTKLNPEQSDQLNFGSLETKDLSDNQPVPPPQPTNFPWPSSHPPITQQPQLSPPQISQLPFQQLMQQQYPQLQPTMTPRVFQRPLMMPQQQPPPQLMVPQPQQIQYQHTQAKVKAAVNTDLTQSENEDEGDNKDQLNSIALKAIIKGIHQGQQQQKKMLDQIIKQNEDLLKQGQKAEQERQQIIEQNKNISNMVGQAFKPFQMMSHLTPQMMGGFPMMNPMNSMLNQQQMSEHFIKHQ
ncbi:hypothetical protein FGO68_gene8995 [Halteria grandinella]|uniref:Uncharacterized protein n=1 Tax=Halteria grandinella TaxID=5974 RepID=A0A8J8P2V6_HALGN|nr:hypothetical protein FGO68_gene8995 [Halteria grandinella]